MKFLLTSHVTYPKKTSDQKSKLINKSLLGIYNGMKKWYILLLVVTHRDALIMHLI